MNILFVAPRSPFPADTGARIRTLNLLKNLAVGNKVTFLAFSFGRDSVDSVGQLAKLGVESHFVPAVDEVKIRALFSRRPLSIEKYSSRLMRDKLKSLIAGGKFDLVHFDHLHMGQYLDCTGSIPSVLDEHNVEAVILARCAQAQKSQLKRWLFKSQAVKMTRFEAESAAKFSRVLTVSEADKQSLDKLCPGQARIEVVPNGVDTSFFRPCYEGRGVRDDGPATNNEQRTTNNDIVFTGSMDWLPNSDAVEYFSKDILPLIWEQMPEVKFFIVGKNPPVQVRRLADNEARIVVTGIVDDVRPYLADAALFVVPLRIGGGTRLKILEAMAMEKAVVSTRVGAEGINYSDGQDILIKDSPSDFAQAVLSLLADKQKRQALGVSGRKLVCAQYDWNIIGRKLDNIYQGVVDRAG